ncbi:MAG TPA: hypothetical protein PKG63_04575 [Bacteroidales bacterium]|nr:hypothetical protein [Bacteroidales bacterium]
MYYKIFITTFFFFSIASQVFCQSFSLSPYSKFGLGDITYTTFQPGLGMGYTSIAQRSNRYINDANPAAASEIDTMTFLTELAINGRNHTITNSLMSKTTTNTDISYFAFSFPIKKGWGTSLGISPYSNVGYNIREQKNIDTLELTNIYKGDGGINEVFLNNGFRLLNIIKSVKISDELQNTHIQNLSLGVRLSYIFGSLDKYSTSNFNNEAYVFDVYKTERFLVSDFSYRLGLQYQISKYETLNGFKTNKYKFCIGLTIDNQNNINSKQTTLITKYLNMLGYVTKDTIENKVNNKGVIQTPLSVGVGFSLSTKDKFTWATDFKMQQWSNTTFFGENSNLKNTIFIGSGIQYIPDPYKFYSYWKMVNYRLGAYYHQTYLNINNNDINEVGITFGLGIPITKTDKGEGTMIRRKLPPMINVALSYGTRGTTSDNLIKEHFIQFSIGLNLQDIWFIKRKYN